MAKEVEKSLGDAPTRLGDKQKSGSEPDTVRSIGDSQTLIGGLAADAGELNDGLELTDLSARYTIVKTLGQGGMGEVLLATDNRLKRQVAIKRIRGEHARSRAAVQRFLTEAQAIAALNHPNIVQVYDYGRDQEGPFLIMEYVDGQNLLDRCKDNPLPIDQAVELTCELLGGLGRAHELGIIHRDIKPANILLTKDGRPKLTDFGLAKQATADHGQTMAGAVLGTIDFMPPEQRRDATLVDARSDLWSLAATLYQMLSGKSPKVIRLDLLPQQLVGVIGKALEESPSQRFQSAAEFRDSLRTGAQSQPTPVSGDFKTGVCPQCGTQSEGGGRFCHECSSPLRVPCLSCGQEIPVWDKGCRECGARQADLIEKKRAELQQLQKEVERLAEAGKPSEAIGLLGRAGELKHPRLRDFQQWVERSRPELNEQSERLVKLASEALADAQAHRAAWDYPAATRALKSIPPGAMGEEHKGLLVRLQAEWTELQQKLQQIQQRVKAKQLDGLLPLVERAVELRGNREDLKKLLGQLQQREAMLAASPPAPPIDPLSEPFESSTGSVTLPGFLGKANHHQSFLQQRWRIIAAAAGAVFLLLCLGWLLSRGGKQATNVAASVESRDTDQSGGVISKEAGSRNQAISGAQRPGDPPASVKSAGASKSSSFTSPQVNPKSPPPQEVVNSIGMKFRLIPAGQFRMGDGEESHDVTLTKPFNMGIFEVTQEQYQRVMGLNPSRNKGSNNPVERVSWNDALLFCQKLSDSEAEKQSGRTYRLPTEAEWEYACRAGTKTVFSFGDDETQLKDYGWFSGNSQNKSHPVGQKKPNSFGLYDMHGNVWEWCSDWCKEYEKKSAIDPAGPLGGTIIVRRGGCWYSGAGFCNSAGRGGREPNNREDDLGFRVVLVTSVKPANQNSTRISPGESNRENSNGQSANRVDSRSIVDSIPKDASTFKGHSYKFFPKQISWKEANAQCVSMGGHLIVIESTEENAFAAKLVENMGMKDSWIGITDEAREGSWISVKGEALPYTNWYGGQPNNGAQNEHYGILSNALLPSGKLVGWKWCDQASRAIDLHKPGYICEWEQEPNK